eukprot:gene1015-335_t
MAEASLPQRSSTTDLLSDMIRRTRNDCERSALNDGNMADSIHFRIDYLTHTIIRINRRKYCVKGPFALWHIDGNHKLIRWRLVFHGGIDGYTRMIVFVTCSNNNRAETVFTSFHGAVQQFGLPSRVRSDKGKENVDVAKYMLTHPLRGPGRGSHITGRSVHNQRNERLWRDVFTGCTHVYYNLFCSMEDSGLLMPTDETHLFALHFVYLPRINKSLQQFVSGFKNSPISTEHFNSPLQMWVRGLMEGRGLDDFDTEIEHKDLINFGIDWDGPIGTDDLHESNDILVPEFVAPTNYLEAVKDINPLAESEFHGVDIY